MAKTKMTAESCFSIIKAFPCVITIILFSFSLYTFDFEYCVLKVYPRPEVYIYLIVETFLFLMYMWCYLHVVFCVGNFDIPSEFEISEIEHKRLIKLDKDVQKKVLSEYIEKIDIKIWQQTKQKIPRYCFICHQLKPDRTHHCSKCNLCVLKMDHHCPWVNNCIGYANQKSFILMLFYGSLYGLFYTTLIIIYFSTQDINNFKLNTHESLIFAGSILTGVGGILVITLLIQHLILLFNNETIIETIQELYFVEDVTFDLGCRTNYLEVFGDNPWLWFIPNTSAKGDGTQYDVAYID